LQKLEAIEHRLESLTQEKQTAKKKLAAIQPRLEAAQEKLNQAEETFLTKGGKIAAEKTYLEAQLQHLQEEAESDRQTLRDLAAGILPLAMIQPLLQQAQSQAQQEIQHQQQEAARDQIQTHDQRLLDFLPSLKLKPTQLKQIQAFLAEEQQALTQSQIDTWLGANADSLHQLASLLKHGLPSQYFSDQADPNPPNPPSLRGKGGTGLPSPCRRGAGGEVNREVWIIQPYPASPGTNPALARLSNQHRCHRTLPSDSRSTRSLRKTQTSVPKSSN
jgi:hypothetical protein